MKTGPAFQSFVLVTVILFVPGCVFTRRSEPRSALDWFSDVSISLLDCVLSDDVDEYRRFNQKNLERREKWQREHPSQ